MRRDRERPPRLAVYSDSDFIGGGELALSSLLGSLDRAIEVTVLGTRAEIVERLAAARPGAGSRLVREVRDRRDLRGMAAHLRAIRELRPDLLQTNGQPWSCQYALGAGLLTRGVRTLAVHHAVVPPVSRGQVLRIRAILSRVDAQVAVSRRGARAVEGMVGLAPGRVRVVHNGVADLAPTPVARPGVGPIVGSVGRLAPEKGYDVLLRALPALPGVDVVLVGDGPERSRLERLARELGVESRVTIAGWQAEPRRWLPTFDVFVLPSRLEGLPLAGIEAMLASRPIVASGIGGVPELVRDGVTGMLVGADDPRSLAAALGGLIEDPDRRLRMGREARRLALREFGLPRMVEAYESIYQELLGRGRADGRPVPAERSGN